MIAGQFQRGHHGKAMRPQEVDAATIIKRTVNDVGAQRPAADLAQTDQIAGIDRHTEMQDLTAGADDPLRPNIAPVQAFLTCG